MSKKLPLLELATGEEFREIYRETFLKNQIFTHDGKKIIFREGNFNHIFFRDKKSSNPVFDTWLAKRMLWIPKILSLEIGGIEVFQQWNKKKSQTERHYIYTFEKFCIFLGQMKNGDFFIITAYRKNNSEIQKMKDSPFLTKLLQNKAGAVDKLNNS